MIAARTTPEDVCRRVALALPANDHAISIDAALWMIADALAPLGPVLIREREAAVELRYVATVARRCNAWVVL